MREEVGAHDVVDAARQVEVVQVVARAAARALRDVHAHDARVAPTARHRLQVVAAPHARHQRRTAPHRRPPRVQLRHERRRRALLIEVLPRLHAPRPELLPELAVHRHRVVDPSGCVRPLLYTIAMVLIVRVGACRHVGNLDWLPVP